MPQARRPAHSPKRGAATSREAAEARILDAAWHLFAEHGLDVPLSRIARAARVTPAVMRSCVKSKKALLERVFKRLFEGRWKPEWDVLLADQSIPLDKRLSRFYVEYRGNIERNGARLWTRAGLMGMHVSGNFSATLNKRMLVPIIQGLRHEAGLRLDRPVNGKHLELAMVLHSAVAFPHTRSFIFGMDVHGGLKALVPMMVRVWLPGARAELKRLDA